MKYEWDECKNEANKKKHGVSFAVAALAFEDENCLIRSGRVGETGEQRWLALGAFRPVAVRESF